MKSVKQSVFEELKNKILSGEYESGFQLKEMDVARQLGVGRTPARQAIKRLAAQGLVVIRSNRRSYVADLTAEQFDQVFDLLVMLEGYSAELAAANISKQQLDLLKELNSRIAKCDMSKPSERITFIDSNTAFHNVIHEASNNDRLCQIIAPLIQTVAFLFVKHGQVDTHAGEDAGHQHAEIIAALESGNGGLAKLHMQLHRESVRSGFASLWHDLESG
jgi:DNA-binding GntR family transcriptional regulator